MSYLSYITNHYQNARSDHANATKATKYIQHYSTNMAESELTRECYSHISVNISDNSGVSVCNKCVEYETLLKEALNELTSLRMINDLLQKDLNPHSTLKNMWQTNYNFTDNTAVPEINGEWTTITSKNHKSKSGKYTQSIIDNSVQFPKLSNRYLPLTTVSVDNVRTIPVIVNRKITANGSNNLNTGASQPPYITKKTVQKHKILIDRMFIGPCIIVIVEELETNLMSLIMFITLNICSTCFEH